MKKIMFSLAVACASAATAFAESWFDNVVTKDPITSGSWSTTISTLMGENDYITYKNMDEDLTFTVVDGKKQTLPSDEATVKTEVKFTAMAREDFDELDKTAWADAKGGLTIIEDPENTYKFYGLVGGTWQELADDTTVTAESIINGNEAVPVEVKIWENGGRKISYKVNNAFIGDSKLGLTASGTGTTISQIAYRGNCEISSLTGDRADEMWEITLSGLLDAIATLKVGGESRSLLDDEKKAGKVSIPATKTDNISIAYAPAPGYMFFAKTGTDKSGKSSAESTQVTVAGDEAIDVVPADYDYAKVVAKVDVGKETEASYQSLANAIAAGANKTVKVVSEPEEAAQTIHANMSLDATGFTVAGNITINANAALTILGGNFSGTLTGALLISGASTFAQVDKDTASGLCTTGWFARQGQTAGSSYVEAGKAEPYVDPSGVQIVYDENEVTPTELAATGANGKPGWVNYAMGLDNVSTTTEMPNIVKEEASTTVLSLAPSTKGRPGTGFVITMTKDDVAFDGNLTLAAGTYVIKTVLSDGKGKTVDVVTKKIGVDNPTVSTAEAADVKLITVPYKQIDGSEMTIDEVINKANLYVGDKLSIYNNGDYDHYMLDNNGAWVMADKAGANSVPTLKPGQGIWLQTGATDFFQYGLVEDAASVAVSAGWNLLGVKAANLAVTAITGAEAGDVIRVENVTTKLPIEYTYDGTDWKYQTTEITTVERAGRTIKLKEITTNVVSEPIPVNGNGVWYVSKSGKATIAL